MNLKSLKRHFCWRGNLQSVIFSTIIAMVLCFPVISDTGVLPIVEPDVTLAVVDTTVEPRVYDLATRSEGIGERDTEPVVQNAIIYKKSEGNGEIRDKIQNTLASNITYIGANDNIEVPITTKTFVIPADPEPVPEPEPVPVVTVNTTNISKPSNLSAEEFDQIINSTLSKYKKTNSKLYGLGETLYELEQTYGNINGLFVLSVISNESGWGTRLANTNNVAGITKKGGGFRAFNSVEECVMYSGGLLSKNYIGQGRTTIASVGAKYCPSTEYAPNQNVLWTDTVSDIMRTYNQTAKKLGLI